MREIRPGLSTRSAYAVHFALVVSLAVVAAIFWVVRDVVQLDLPLIAIRIMRYGAVVELVVVGVLVNRIRSRMSLQQPETELDPWWHTNGAKVVVTWALTQSSGLTGVMLWLLTGDALILAAVVAGSLVMLLRLGPSHWRAEPSPPSRLVP